LRQKRLERGLTQEKLSIDSNVSKSSIERIENGKPTQITTLRMIAKTLGNVDVKELIIFDENEEEFDKGRNNQNISSSPEKESKKGDVKIDCIRFGCEMAKINAIRFIPFYVGKIPTKDFKNYLDFSVCCIGDFKMVYFEDGFVVAVVPEIHQCTNIPEFLWQRRIAHLDLLERDSQILKLLLNKQEIKSSNPLVLSLPDAFHYVMSIHHVTNIDNVFSRNNLILMTEPSILGITDNPKEKLVNTSDNIFINETMFNNPNIFEIKTNQANYYIGWANVAVENIKDSIKHLDLIIGLEIKLQKLWYKLYMCSKTLDKITAGIEHFDKDILRKMKMEAIKTKIEFTNFISIEATGSTHMNEIHKQLIKTSNLNELYNNFENKYKLLEELEEVL